MSMIGMIEVYRCDGCDATKVVSDEVDRAVFESEWVGLFKHFCPRCNLKIEHQDAIIEQERRIAEIRTITREMVVGQGGQRYVH